MGRRHKSASVIRHSIEDLNPWISHRKVQCLLNFLLKTNGTYEGNEPFIAAISFLPEQNHLQLIERCKNWSVKVKYDSKSDFLDYEDGSMHATALLERLNNHHKMHILMHPEILKFLEEELRHLKELANPMSCLLARKLEELKSLFNLNQAEIEILLAIYLTSTDNDMSNLEDTIRNTFKIRSYNSKLPNSRILSILTGLTQADITGALASKGTIARLSLMESNDSLATEVHEYLSGTSSNALSERYFKRHEGATLPVEAHTVKSCDRDTLYNILRAHEGPRGLNILFYGEPGTGKTEFARTLASDLGLGLYEINHVDSGENHASDFRFRALMACQQVAGPGKSIMLIDEADDMLNTQSGFFLFATPDKGKKGLVNHVLDDFPSRRIWITNHYDNIDNSTRRRFDYSVQFRKMTKNQRVSVWNTCLQKHGLDNFLEPGEIAELAEKYEINAGGIEVALKNAKTLLAKGLDRSRVAESMKNVILSHVKLMNITDQRNPSAPNANAYSLDGLNVRGSLETIMVTLQQFSDYWKENEQENMAIRNMNVLLYGPPGTGKTEFAKHVARILERPLIKRQASDLLSKWVGGSEKNIREAFEKTESEKGILFIDEADGLFSSRERAQNSWEITQANEILTNMESFRGILICATNFRKCLDSAAIRRFNIKLEFDFLTPEGNMMFFNRFLSELSQSPLAVEETARIREIRGLAPGDFKVVFQSRVFRKKGSVSNSELIDALADEVRNKDGFSGKAMGF